VFFFFFFAISHVYLDLVTKEDHGTSSSHLKSNTKQKSKTQD